MKEDVSENSAAIIENVQIMVAPPHPSGKPPVDPKKAKKKRGTFTLLKSVLSAWQRPRVVPADQLKLPTKETQRSPSSKGKWQKLVGSMRPLHLQEDINGGESPPPAAEETAINIPDSPTASTSSSMSVTSGSGSMSQYASANNLQELDEVDEDEEEDPDEVFDALCGDEMIDYKADQFISQFYRQMRMQESYWPQRYYHDDDDEADHKKGRKEV